MRTNEHAGSSTRPIAVARSKAKLPIVVLIFKIWQHTCHDLRKSRGDDGSEKFCFDYRLRLKLQSLQAGYVLILTVNWLILVSEQCASTSQYCTNALHTFYIIAHNLNELHDIAQPLHCVAIVQRDLPLDSIGRQLHIIFRFTLRQFCVS